MRILAMILIPAFITGACMSNGGKMENGLTNIKVDRDDVDARIYKVIYKRKLQLHIFYPAGYSSENPEQYPAAVSIHGGAWTQGPIEWGYGDAQFMASLGFVGIAVDYRLAGTGGITVGECMKDVNSSIRWVRTYAEELNVDPNRILAIGHSAGGHLVLSAALFPHIMEEGEEESISSLPNAVVALAPAVDLDRDNYFQSLCGPIRASACSPADHIKKLDIPVLIIHGSKDEVLPVAYTKKFAEDMKAEGNRIDLRIYPGGSHNFFYEDEKGLRFWQDLVREFVKDF